MILGRLLTPLAREASALAVNNPAITTIATIPVFHPALTPRTKQASKARLREPTRSRRGSFDVSSRLSALILTNPNLPRPVFQRLSPRHRREA